MLSSIWDLQGDILIWESEIEDEELGENLNHQYYTSKVISSVKSEKSGDVNPSNEEGETPLHLAAYHGHLAICEVIIQELENVDPEENDGSTPLHVAAKRGHLEIFKLIFDKIEVKNPRNQDGITPLHNAAYQGHFMTL